MLMRYAMLLAAAATAVWGAINLGTTNADAFLVDAGQGVAPAQPGLWALGAVAGFITLSLFRLVIFGLPSMMDDWYRDNKSWIYIAGAGGMIYAAFYLM
jgi:hypothetical protein